MQLAKYFGTNEEGHGGRLEWPGTLDGYPMRLKGPGRPLLKQDEIEQVPLVFDAKIKIFDLSKPADVQAYQDILDRHYNSWYRITSKKEEYDTTTHSWRVKLEWVQIYGEVPSTKVPSTFDT